MPSGSWNLTAESSVHHSVVAILNSVVHRKGITSVLNFVNWGEKGHVRSVMALKGEFCVHLAPLQGVLRLCANIVRGIVCIIGV